MTPEQWQEVKELLAAALEREPRHRKAYLDEVCRMSWLRREVESLIAAQGQAELGFLEPPRSDTSEFSQMTLAPGAEVGPYQILAFLGAGGMGEVYEALDPRLNRHVALKVVTQEALTPRFQRLFIREARTVASLNHPNIAQVYETGEAGGTCYIAMELVEGETLRSKMKAMASTLPELLGYLLQTAGALVNAHAKGVIHCDLKPDNIMVTSDGLVKVLDFGLAKLLERYRRDLPSGRSQITKRTLTSLSESGVGLVEGTVGYMSPEQAEGKSDIDERSDIFSFGCLLFEAATHKLPFAGESPLRTFHNVLYEPAPRIGTLWRGAPQGLQRVVDRCLEKEPAQRFSNMAEVCDCLSDILQEIEKIEPPATEHKPHFGLIPATRRIGKRNLFPRWVKGWAGRSILFALAITASAIGYVRWRPAESLPVLAVIPFTNSSETPENQYLSDGISEELINSLAQLPNLKVIARSSSFKFKSQEIDIQNVARTLNAKVVVTGRVAVMGGQLRITAELVNGSSGIEIWGGQYDAALSNLPTVQGEISREIADRVRSKLTQSDEARITKQMKTNPAAYELLLRGRYQMWLYTTESRKRAAEYYQQALAIDPGFALANAELASAYRLLAGSGVLSPADMMPKAEMAAREALATNPDLAEAHAALANIKKDEWDWKTAGQEYRRALELNPNLAAAHLEFAIYLSVMGRFDAARLEVQRAHELDPIGLPTAITSAAVYYNARQYDQALDVLRATADFDPTSPNSWTWMGIVNGGSGHDASAVSAYEKAISLGDHTTATQCYYAFSVSRLGKRDQALRIVQDLERSKVYVPPTSLAIAYLGLGQQERAFQALQIAYEFRDPLLQYLKVESHFDGLKNDPRYQDLAAQIGLPK